MLFARPDSDELDLDHRGRVTWTQPELDDAGEAGSPVGILRRELADQLVDDERLMRHLADELTTGVQVAALCERDHAVNEAANFLGLGLRGPHLLVADHGYRQVPEHRHAMRVLAAELASGDTMRHRPRLPGRARPRPPRRARPSPEGRTRRCSSRSPRGR